MLNFDSVSDDPRCKYVESGEVLLLGFFRSLRPLRSNLKTAVRKEPDRDLLVLHSLMAFVTISLRYIQKLLSIILWGHQIQGQR